MVGCQKGTSVSMRIAVSANFITGIVLIVFGCQIQNPPSSFAPVAFVVLGAINLFASLMGFWGSYNKKKLLMGFVIFGGISVLLQIGLVLALIFDFDAVMKKIKSTDDESYDRIAKMLNLSRWVALGFIFLELMTLIMAILLRFVIKDDIPYTSFSGDGFEKRSAGLDGLARDIEKSNTRGKTMSEKAYDKIRAKMSAKYGNLSHTDVDWKSKTKFSWR